MVHTFEKQSFYDVLGVSPIAAPEAIRKAYKRLILETHPDKLSLEATDSERELSETRFKEIRSAFEVLSDPTKRRQYDCGLYFLRRQECRAERNAQLNRERKEWEEKLEMRRQERMRAKQEMERARNQRRREAESQVQKEEASTRVAYAKRRAAELQLCIDYQTNQKVILYVERKCVDKVKTLEQEVRAQREQLQHTALVNLPQARGLAPVRRVDDFLEELRKMNPEWEARRQAALRRREERMHSQNSM